MSKLHCHREERLPETPEVGDLRRGLLLVTLKAGPQALSYLICVLVVVGPWRTTNCFHVHSPWTPQLLCLLKSHTYFLLFSVVLKGPPMAKQGFHH